MKALLVDADTMEIIKEIEVLSFTVKDGMYYHTEDGFIPIAYLMKLKNRKYIEKCGEDYRKQRRQFRKYEYDMWTVNMASYRI